jgi:hypothetical protein
MHLTTLVSNESPLVSEHVRTFMGRIEEQRKPLQISLPIRMSGDDSVQPRQESLKGAIRP